MIIFILADTLPGELPRGSPESPKRLPTTLCGGVVLHLMCKYSCCCHLQ